MIGAFFTRFTTWLSGVGKVRVKAADVEEAVFQGFYKASIGFLQHAEIAEYHDAMAAMLYHRRKRLQTDPFNTQFFDHDDSTEEIPVKRKQH